MTTPPKPRRKAIDVHVIEYRTKSVVVEVKNAREWYRSVVPLEALKVTGMGVGVVFDDDLEAGRYGEDWASIAETLVKTFPKRFSDAMHAQGIFSFADLRAKVPQAKAALMTAYEFDLASLVRKEQ